MPKKEFKKDLFAEQLYSIYLHMADESLGSDDMPRKRGFEALKRLTQTSDLREQGYDKQFAVEAVGNILQQIERIKAAEEDNKPLARDAFKSAIDIKLKTFERYYTALPENECIDINNALEEVNSSVKEMSVSYTKEMEAIRENLRTLGDTIGRLNRKDKLSHDGKKPGDAASFEDLKEIYLANVDSIKQQLAVMVAMDELCRRGGPAAALNPDLVDRNAELLRSGEENEIDMLFDRMEEGGMTADAIGSALRGSGYDELSDFMSKEVKPAPKINERSAIGLFKKGLESLRKDLAPESIIYEKSAEELADGLLELFALRELGRRDPFWDASRADIESIMEQIKNPKKDDDPKKKESSDIKLYRAVYKKALKDRKVAERVIEGINGSDNMQHFRGSLMKNAGLKHNVSVKENAEKAKNSDGPKIQ